MKKITLVVFALIIALLAAFLGAWFSAPVYPEYIRRVESFEEQKRHLSHSDLVLLDFGAMRDAEYDILLSSRTRLAKPVGYIISWTESIERTSCLCFLICNEQEITGVSVDTYLSIPIYEISSSSIGVILNNHNYVLSWNSKDETDIEDPNQLKDMATKEMIAYAKKIIDASKNENVKGN